VGRREPRSDHPLAMAFAVRRGKNGRCGRAARPRRPPRPRRAGHRPREPGRGRRGPAACLAAPHPPLPQPCAGVRLRLRTSTSPGTATRPRARAHRRQHRVGGCSRPSARASPSAPRASEREIGEREKDDRWVPPTCGSHVSKTTPHPKPPGWSNVNGFEN